MIYLMNKTQWFILSAGLILLGVSLITFATSWNKICTNTLFSSTEDATLYTACVIKAQSYAIPAIISFSLGLLIIFIGYFEDEKKHR